MKLSLDDIPHHLVITAYSASSVTVGEKMLTASFLLGPERLNEDWPVSTCAEITRSHIEAIGDLQPEIVVLGTGTAQHFPDGWVYVELAARNIGLEVMDTGAACRTYNILRGEGRRVLAALML